MDPKVVKSTLSLIKYGKPFIVDETDEDRTDITTPTMSIFMSHSKTSALLNGEENTSESNPGWPMKRQEEGAVTIQEILNCITPPKTWKMGNLKWMKQLSTEPVTRKEIGFLISKLDNRLDQLKVRKTGFCPIRSQLYEEAFSEVIRQVTLRCAEQGLLLIRIRNEAMMTLKAYQTLYENSTALAVSKIEQVKVNKEDLEQQIQEEEEELLGLDRELMETQQKYKMVEKRSSELVEAIIRVEEHDTEYIGNAMRQLQVMTNIFGRDPTEEEKT